MAFSYKPVRFDDLNAVNTVNPVSGICQTHEEIALTLSKIIPDGLTLLDGIPGADFSTLLESIRQVTPGIITINVTCLYHTDEEIQKVFSPYLSMDRESDPELIFGKLFDQEYSSIFDREKVDKFLATLANNKTVLLYGHGSACDLFRSKAKTLLFIDVTPKDTALRVFDGLYRCLGQPADSNLDTIVRQTYFIDLELSTALRKDLIMHNLVDYYLLDSELSISMMNRKSLIEILDQLKKRPLRAKPVYVEGVWGGQFIKRYRGIPEDLVDKISWSFELIPTEASLLVSTDTTLLDIPFLTVMDAIGSELIGETLNTHFSGKFPVRFNYDDTWHSDGNMSIQCHPNDQMVQQLYGDFAAQNEAYYVVLTGHGAKTFCGFRSDGKEFLNLCKKSEKDGSVVPYEKYINAIRSEVGRQIFLPSGTVHSSGRNQIVLELGTLTVSAYTYKIYDYNRLDITGKQRPLHTKLAGQALDFERDSAWVEKNVAFEPKLLEEEPTYREYLVGQYESMYFETHRVELSTRSTYNGKNTSGFTVITVVDGESVRIQSCDDPSLSYDARYLDVVLIPATITDYEVIATGKQPVVVHKTIIREENFRSWQKS